LDPEVASIGYNERRAKEAGIEYVKHVETLAHNDRALAEGENKGMIKILMNKKGRVIGVQIVGYHAGDLIAEWIPVLNGAGKLSTVANAIHPYPTLSEINKNASVNYMVSTIPPWTKKLTKRLFGYRGKA
jgi:pyruvate/2-oxoglutarate dehydrogenase complex dihydrolipoamide dehydrogenase (E3) component